MKKKIIATIMAISMVSNLGSAYGNTYSLEKLEGEDVVELEEVLEDDVGGDLRGVGEDLEVKEGKDIGEGESGFQGGLKGTDFDEEVTEELECQPNNLVSENTYEGEEIADTSEEDEVTNETGESTESTGNPEDLNSNAADESEGSLGGGTIEIVEPAEGEETEITKPKEPTEQPEGPGQLEEIEIPELPEILVEPEEPKQPEEPAEPEQSEEPEDKDHLEEPEQPEQSEIEQQPEDQDDNISQGQDSTGILGNQSFEVIDYILEDYPGSFEINMTEKTFIGTPVRLKNTGTKALIVYADTCRSLDKESPKVVSPDTFSDWDSIGFLDTHNNIAFGFLIKNGDKEETYWFKAEEEQRKDYMCVVNPGEEITIEIIAKNGYKWERYCDLNYDCILGFEAVSYRGLEE